MRNRFFPRPRRIVTDDNNIETREDREKVIREQLEALKAIEEEEGNEARAEKDMLARWEKQIDLVYTELMAEFQSACDKHIEAISVSLKEVVKHDYRYSVRAKNLKNNILAKRNENVGNNHVAMAGNLEDEQYDETFDDLFKVQYGEMSVLERLWRHREWANTVWICLGYLVIVMLANIAITLYGNQSIAILRTGTKTLLCSVTNDSDMCNDLGTKVPTITEMLSLTENSIKEEFQIHFNYIKKEIQKLNQELNLELNKSTTIETI